MVVFEIIRYKNFMSVGNTQIEIPLNKHATTLISATNGSGKSIMLDAICYVLFGKAYRKVNLDQLLNSINLKQLVVEIEFSIGTKKYKVVRGMKPSIFQIYVDGTLLNVEASSRDYQSILEKNILGFNRRAFTQVVVMGSASYVPFMKLEKKDRRAFIEDLLNILVFSEMSKLANKDFTTKSDELKTINNKLASLKEIILVIHNQVKKQEDSTKGHIEQLGSKISGLIRRNDDLQEMLNDLRSQYNDESKIKTEVDAKKQKLSVLLDMRRKIAQKLGDINSNLDHFCSMDTCPTCTQNIGDGVKSKYSSDINPKKVEYEDGLAKIDQKIFQFNSVDAEMNEVVVRMNSINQNMQRLNTEMYGNSMLIDNSRRELSELQGVDVSEEREKLRDYAKQLIELEQKKDELAKKHALIAPAQLMLKDDGAKAKIIKQYIPEINRLVNLNLSKLDFFCQFILDEEFNECVKSRHRDAFTYDSFSQGEKQRIDLSLLFAWREIAAKKNSLYTNLIVLDEILDSAMDGTGLDLCFNLIRDMKKTNVFVISHRETISEHFDHTIKLTKKNNFTQIVN